MDRWQPGRDPFGDPIRAPVDPVNSVHKLAEQTWSIGGIELELSHGYDCAQGFAPRDCDVAALEPMTAPTDALRSGDGLRLLPGGAGCVARFALTCHD